MCIYSCWLILSVYILSLVDITSAHILLLMVDIKCVYTIVG